MDKYLQQAIAEQEAEDEAKARASNKASAPLNKVLSDEDAINMAIQEEDELYDTDPIPPSRIDNKESDRIAIGDRIMALNVGDPKGALKKFRTDPAYKGLTFKRDSAGEIVFKSPKASAWSSLDPKEPAAWYNPLPKRMFPNAIITKDLGRDILDILPDAAQTAATSLATLAGTRAGGLAQGSAFAAAADATAEGLRQNIGVMSGWRDAPMSGLDIATHGGVGGVSNLLGGIPISPRTALSVAKGTTNQSILRSKLPNWLPGSTKEAELRGVEILNPGHGIETPQILRKDLEPIAAEAIQDSGRGLISRAADGLVAKATRIDPESQKRAAEPLSDSVKDTLKKSGVTFSVNKTPKNYIDVAEEIYTQNAGGKIIEQVKNKALDAVKKSKLAVGKRLEDVMNKSKVTIDLSEEKSIFDARIAELKASKAADPTGATHFDDDIKAMEEIRNQIFGSGVKPPTRDTSPKGLSSAVLQALRKGMAPEDIERLRKTDPGSIYAFIEGPAKPDNLVVPAKVAYEKLKALSNEIAFGKSTAGKSAAELTKRSKAIEAWDRLAAKVDSAIEESGEERLRSLYKKDVRNQKSIETLFSSINTGLSTARSAFNTSKGHIRRDILDFDKEYKTDVLGDLTLFDVAKVHGAPESWFPKSINGSTSTSATLNGQAIGSAIASATGAEKGGALESLSRFAGDILFSPKASGGLLKLQRMWKEAAKTKNDTLALPLSQIPNSVWLNMNNRSKENK